MNIKEIKKRLIDAGVEPNEAQVEAQMFVEHFLSLDAVKLAINPEFSACEELERAVAVRCEKQIPIQHILGKAYFMGEYFKVNENTLIPRPETELLVREAVSKIKSKGFEFVLDIGTGTGCIACMIAKSTEARVLGVDVSSAALQVALDNSSALNLFNRAIFRKSDLFSNVGETFDVIVSNPPYIPTSEKENLQREVRFESELALFADDVEGVKFYKTITEQCGKYLNAGGYLMFELGIGQAQTVKGFLEENGFVDIEIIKDLSYIDRVIVGRKL